MNTIEENRTTAVEPVQVIVKAFDIIEALARKGEMGISELSEETRFTKSLIYRFVRTLIQFGYVKQNQDNDKYDLTLRLFEIGSAVLGRSDVLSAARNVAEKLARTTREAIHVAVLEDQDIIFVDTAASDYALTMSPRIGGRVPAYCTALGRVLLSAKSDAEITEIYQNLHFTRRTQNTVNNLETLLPIIQKIREDGFAVENEEFEAGLICIATPLRDHYGSIAAAIAMAAPRIRLPDSRIEEVIEIMKDASEQVANLTSASRTKSKMPAV